MEVCVGTAGWSVPKMAGHRFGGDGSHLSRYAQVLNCAEINSSFKHEHRASTYARWAASTPPGFKFSVKVPHEITHRLRLQRVEEPLARFLGVVGELGERLGPLLVQLPASFRFDPGVATAFFDLLRRRFDGAVVCEPRHPDWFGPGAEAVYAAHRIGRVAADPARLAAAADPGGWLGDASRAGVVYYRWHGAPVMYRSSYADDRLATLGHALCQWQAQGAACWCIFDNTASGAATPNALDLKDAVQRGGLVER